jgi:hypothetical protein
LKENFNDIQSCHLRPATGNAQTVDGEEPFKKTEKYVALRSELNVWFN